MAVFYYTSQYFIWWDFGGMAIQELNIGGIDPNCLHPKPRPTTPQELFDYHFFLYQKQTISKKNPTRTPQFHCLDLLSFVKGVIWVG